MSGSGSDLFLLDESGSWTSDNLAYETDDSELKLGTLLGIVGASVFFIGLYGIRFWCDKRAMNL
tara:strand:+ start:1895 stop:2086 length:192 start_codon:yes stop_codon:yes gene_type:complete